MREPNHLLFNDCHLSVVLEHFDQWLAADRCRETLAWKLDAHMRCQLIYSVELALREEFPVKLRRRLRQMQNLLQLRLEDKLSKFIVDFEAFLYARVVQVSKRLVHHLDSRRFLGRRTLYFDGTCNAVEVVCVFSEESLLRAVDIALRFE